MPGSLAIAGSSARSYTISGNTIGGAVLQDIDLVVGSSLDDRFNFGTSAEVGTVDGGQGNDSITGSANSAQPQNSIQALVRNASVSV